MGKPKKTIKDIELDKEQERKEQARARFDEDFQTWELGVWIVGILTTISFIGLTTAIIVL